MAINRMKTARQEKEFISTLKAQGKHRNDRSLGKNRSNRSKSPYKSVSKKDSSNILQQSIYSIGTEKKTPFFVPGYNTKSKAKRSKSRTQ